MAYNFLSYLRLPFLASSGLSVVSLGALYWRQNDLIYPASMPGDARCAKPSPSDFRIADHNFESISLTTSDSEELHSYLIRPSDQHLTKKITILMFHGNAGNIGHRLPIAKVLSQSLGCHVFMLEYRGYGASTGSPSEAGITIDAQKALDYIRQRPELRHNRIVIYGQSLGGAVAIKLVAANQAAGDIKGVILENTFTSLRQMVPAIMPYLKYVTWLCHQVWASAETLPKITADIPFLFLSGLKDELVPPKMMRELFEQCKANPKRKRWVTFPAGDHNNTVSEAGYFDAIWEFLVQEVVDGGAKDLTLGSTKVSESELLSSNTLI